MESQEKDIFKSSSSTTEQGKVKSFLKKDSTKAALSFLGIVTSVAIEVFCDTSKSKKNDDDELAYVDDDGQRHSNNGDLMW